MPEARALYIFVDEGGNFDFSRNGTEYFTLTSMTRFRPFLLDDRLNDLRFDLLEEGHSFERFHASDDKQPTRNRVFAEICECLPSLRVDSVIVEKRKTGPSLREPNKFYPRMLGYLLKYVLNGIDLTKWSEIIVITDTIPWAKKRKAIEKAVKVTLAEHLPSDVPYRILHHDGRSCYGLQIVDYMNWAIYRKWSTGDARSFDLIKSRVRSQFDIFHRGDHYWY